MFWHTQHEHEHRAAGGHNAPPRGEPRLNDRGEPIYGQRDEVDLAAFRSIGPPFWLAGSYGTPERVVEALEAGAAGVQVGTAFAFSKESGLRDDIRRHVLELSRETVPDVFTDPVASPTGFPFKVLCLDGSISDPAVYDRRTRRCDLGFLRHAYEKPDGSLGWRCPAELPEVYVRKGGDLTDTVGRKCICNGLMATIGLGQVRTGGETEPPIVTCGDDVGSVSRFLLSPEANGYSAKDVVDYLLSMVESAQVKRRDTSKSQVQVVR